LSLGRLTIDDPARLGKRSNFFDGLNASEWSAVFDSAASTDLQDHSIAIYLLFIKAAV
jgi:hypothetical protein